jgi:hypothetical protein
MWLISASNVEVTRAARFCFCCKEYAMAHKFKIGQLVDFSPGRTSMSAAGQRYEVIRQLPVQDGQYQYRIKCKSETFERVAKESEMA